MSDKHDKWERDLQRDIDFALMMCLIEEAEEEKAADEITPEARYTPPYQTPAQSGDSGQWDIWSYLGCGMIAVIAFVILGIVGRVVFGG